jgi:predicted NBD/HSP70 family sugar kinase
VIGEVVAMVVSLLNPAEVVLGGMLASAPLLTGVREALYPRSLPRATRHLRVGLATLGRHGATAGLAALVVDREYSAAAVDRSLSH